MRYSTRSSSQGIVHQIPKTKRYYQRRVNKLTHGSAAGAALIPKLGIRNLEP
jgi:hypothetical protein